MTPFEVYCAYCAIKLHFITDSYDYHKYNGKTKTSTVAAFEKRKDKYFFEKIARKNQNPFGYVLANLVHAPNVAPPQMTDHVYAAWRARIESLSYTVKNDLKVFEPDFDENLKYNNTHPIVFKHYLANRIAPETITILADLCRLGPYWDRQMGDDPVYKQYRNRIIKYAPFLTYDKDSLKLFILAEFNREK